MNKKTLLLLVLSIINISLLYGEDQTEKLVRKSDSIFRMVNDKRITGGLARCEVLLSRNTGYAMRQT